MNNCKPLHTGTTQCPQDNLSHDEIFDYIISPKKDLKYNFFGEKVKAALSKHGKVMVIEFDPK